MTKFRILEHTKIEFNGHIIYRIEATKDFGDVKAGDLGGYVETEGNLSDEGDCWIYDDAIVCDCAKVKDNAKVYDKAKIIGCSQVSENAKIYGNARLIDATQVCESSQVYGHALIENAIVRGNAHVCGYAHCSGNCVITEDAEVYGNSIITKNATVSGEAIIYGESYIAKATITGTAKINSKEIKSSRDYVCK